MNADMETERNKKKNHKCFPRLRVVRILFFLYRQVLYFGLLSWVRMCSENGTYDKMCLRDTRKTF